MILPVLQYPDPRLKQKCADIDEITPEIKELAENMFETMYARNGVGLAAPQVGVCLNLVVTDTSGPEARSKPRVFINPKLALDGEWVEGEEGCLSVSASTYRAMVKRRSKLRLKALDLEGNPIDEELEGLNAVCLQHECDHLDGILFIDHISRLKRSMFDKKIAKAKK